MVGNVSILSLLCVAWDNHACWGYQSLHVCVMVFPTYITDGEENGG